MSLQFHDTDRSISETLLELAETLPNGKVSVRQLIEHLGEQGLLLLCVILCLPFLFPVSLPGVSTVFSALIVFVAIGILANRIPWFPHRLVAHETEAEHLKNSLRTSGKFFARLDRFVRPRLLGLTKNAAVNRINALCLLAGGLLLMLPLGFVPFSNTLPAWSIILISLGMLQRDGIFILLSYLLVAASVVYFGGLAVIVGFGVYSFV